MDLCAGLFHSPLMGARWNLEYHVQLVMCCAIPAVNESPCL
ncbi:hypothetical protein MIZ03_0846 [Rhodoferax lithotrophicus]|uniref:Uncharacterized protein n=1 Tax=Rhodoferax lithotrophicus TaxID=2798804 RepID=A0ABM7MI77_9BURK|nr:hypothetical protein MIZ03_0846 [Rhodoferax sp. MIZ03]